MLQDEILSIKFLPISGLAAYAIVTCEVTILAHKSQNNSVKVENFINISFLLPSAQNTDVFLMSWSANSSKKTQPKDS